MRKPRISVLMPAYNAEKYLAEAIDSILGQTFGDFELIIINDGSTDNTANIVRKYKDKRIKFIDNKHNAGLIAVLNHGLDIARGEYVARMDADDISIPERFAKQVAFLDANPDVGLLGTCYKRFTSTSSKTAIVKHPKFVDYFKLLAGCYVAHPTAMFRRELFNRYDLRYDPDYRVCEDYELWSRVVRVTKIANLQESLLDYRVHGESESITKGAIQQANDRRVKQNMLDFLTSDGTMQQLIFGEVSQSRVKLFGFIPIIRAKEWHNATIKKKIYLFEIIPLLKIRKHRIYLFQFIPFASIKTKVIK